MIFIMNFHSHIHTYIHPYSRIIWFHKEVKDVRCVFVSLNHTAIMGKRCRLLFMMRSSMA